MLQKRYGKVREEPFGDGLLYNLRNIAMKLENKNY
jgi:hypothetical protein